MCHDRGFQLLLMVKLSKKLKYDASSQRLTNSQESISEVDSFIELPDHIADSQAANAMRNTEKNKEIIAL